jgi:nucleotide-binding universal stress UspA family protein
VIALKNILVPTDFGDASESALTYGRALAKSFGAELHLLHVIENLFLRAVVADPATLEAAARRTLSERLTADDSRALRARPVIKKSDEPADAIVSYAKVEAIDLIVMGTHGRTGAAHMFMGSVAERVVRLAPCPVLTVRHPEREFVVAGVRWEFEVSRRLRDLGGI